MAGVQVNGYIFKNTAAPSTTTASTTGTSTASTTSASSTVTSPASSGLSSGAKTGIGIGVALGAVAVIGFLAAWWSIRRKRQAAAMMNVYAPAPQNGDTFHDTENGVARPPEKGPGTALEPAELTMGQRPQELDGDIHDNAAELA